MKNLFPVLAVAAFVALVVKKKKPTVLDTEAIVSASLPTDSAVANRK